MTWRTSQSKAATASVIRGEPDGAASQRQQPKSHGFMPGQAGKSVGDNIVLNPEHADAEHAIGADRVAYRAAAMEAGQDEWRTH